MAEFFQLGKTRPGRGAKVATPAGWQFFVAVWANDAPSTQGIAEAIADFWTSGALLVEREADLTQALLASVNHGLRAREQDGDCDVGVVLVTEQAIYWGHRGPGRMMQVSGDDRWRRLTPPDGEWCSGGLSRASACGVALFPPWEKPLPKKVKINLSRSVRRNQGVALETAFSGNALAVLVGRAEAPKPSKAPDRAGVRRQVPEHPTRDIRRSEAPGSQGPRGDRPGVRNQAPQEDVVARFIRRFSDIFGRRGR